MRLLARRGHVVNLTREDGKKIAKVRICSEDFKLLEASATEQNLPVDQLLIKIIRSLVEKNNSQ